MRNKDGGPAFPHANVRQVTNNGAWKDWHIEHGMTLRDYFAGQALTGLLAEGSDSSFSVVVSCAYDIAGAMLEERAKRMKNDGQ